MALAAGIGAPVVAVDGTSIRALDPVPPIDQSMADELELER